MSETKKVEGWMPVRPDSFFNDHRAQLSIALLLHGLPDHQRRGPLRSLWRTHRKHSPIERKTQNF